MRFKIPFTNFALKINAEGVSISRPRIYNRGVRTSWGNSLNERVNANALFKVYRRQSDVYSTVRELRENVGLAGYEWQDLEGNVVVSQVTDELDRILNYFQTWGRSKSRIVRDGSVAGNSYFHITKNQSNNMVLGIEMIDPRTMSLVTNEFGDVKGYVQTIGGMARQVFEPDEIVHFKNDTDPDNEIFGFAPLETVIIEAKTDLSAMHTNFNFFEHSAQPAAQYILEEGLSPEAGKNAIEMIKSQFKGVKNAHKSGVLQGVKEIKTLTVTQKDMEYLNGRRFSTEKICATMGVPKFLLGYTESVNNNNGVELNKKFYEGTILPIEANIEQVMTRDFLKKIGVEGLQFKFKPQVFDAQGTEKRALEEKKQGALTLRQYKQKTGQEITPEDEKALNFDAYIIQGGSSAVLLEDVGVDPLDDPSEEQSNNLIKKLKEYSDEEND